MTDEIIGLTQGDTYRSADAWAWAHEREVGGAPIGINPDAVCAVLVVHNAAEWLPRQLLSLAALDPRPGRIIAVDNGSEDASGDLLRRAQAEGVLSEVLVGSADQGFGAAVAQALDGRELPEWLWLLHDDSAPKRRALAELLRCASDRDADVLVPKLLLPKRRNYPDQVLEVGRSIAPDGRQVLSVDPGDIDQHQLDSEPTLGGSSAGMLVRGEAWQRLGGFDPAIPLFRDGVEFGWRANELGLKVITCPQAALYHRQAGRLGWRDSTLAPRSQASDRLAAMRLLVARAEHPGRAKWWLNGVAAVRSFGYLLGKSPAQAGDELRALRTLSSTADETAALRDRLAERAPAELTSVTKLLPGQFSGVRHVVDRFAGSLVERYRDLVSTESDTSIDELTGDDYAGRHVVRRHVAPIALVSLILLVVGIAAIRGLFGGGEVSGGSLLPAPTSLAAAWDAFVRPTAGVPGGSPLWLGLMALGSTVTFGQPAWFVLVLLACGPLLAAWSANALLRLFLEGARLRALIAGAWGAAVWLFGFVGSGSLTGIAFAIGAPMFVRSCYRWWHRPPEGAERWRGPAATAGWLVLLTAAYPLAWVLAIPAGAYWVFKDRARLPEVGVALGGPLILMLGWLPALLSNPGRFLTGTDPLAARIDVAGPLLLFGVTNTGASQPLVAVAFVGALLVAFGLALFLGGFGRAQWWVLGCVGVGYIMAALLSRLIVPVNGGVARPELAPWMLLALGGLLAGLAFAEWVDQSRFRRVPVALAAGGTALVLAWTAIVGISGPVGRSNTVLPSYVATVQNSVRQTRTLIIDLSGGAARWAVVAAEQPRWGSAERNPISTDADLANGLLIVAQSFARGQVADDVATRLAALGVGHVWLRGAAPDQVAAISNAAGLTRAAADDYSQVWTVTGLVSRARVVTGSATESLPDGQLDAGAEGRLLTLAEAQDSRWQASIDGAALSRTSDAGVTFTLPSNGGRVSWSMKPASWYVALQAVTALVLIVLAAPVVGASTRARRGKDE